MKFWKDIEHAKHRKRHREKIGRKGLHTENKENKNKAVYIRVWPEKQVQKGPTQRPSSARRGAARLSPSRRVLLGGLCTDGRLHVPVWGGPSSPRQHAAPVTGLKAGTLHRWKISFRQHNLGIKNNIDPFASWPKRNQVRQRKLGNRFNMTPTAMAKST